MKQTSSINHFIDQEKCHSLKKKSGGQKVGGSVVFEKKSGGQNSKSGGQNLPTVLTQFPPFWRVLDIRWIMHVIGAFDLRWVHVMLKNTFSP